MEVIHGEPVISRVKFLATQFGRVDRPGEGFLCAERLENRLLTIRRRYVTIRSRRLFSIVL